MKKLKPDNETGAPHRGQSIPVSFGNEIRWQLRMNRQAWTVAANHDAKRVIVISHGGIGGRAGERGLNVAQRVVQAIRTFIGNYSQSIA